MGKRDSNVREKGKISRKDPVFWIPVLSVALAVFGIILCFGVSEETDAGYRGVALFVGILGGIGTALMSWLFGRNRLSLENTYLGIGLIFTICFVFIIPMFATPDEKAHFDTAYTMAAEGMPFELTSPLGYRLYRETDLAYEEPYIDKDSYQNFWETMDDDVTGGMGWKPDNTLRDRIGYGLVVLLMKLCFVLNINFGWMCILTSLANGIFFVLVTYLAMRLLPFGKRTLFFICLFPIVLQQSTSLSYDNHLLAASIFVTCMAVHWKYDDTKIVWWEVLGYLAACIFVITIKSGVYAPLAVLPVLWSLKRSWFQGKRKLIWLGGMAVVVLLGTLIWWKSGIGSTIFGILQEPRYIVDLEQNARAPIELLQHPLEFLKILFHTALSEGKGLLYQLFGGALGWLAIFVPGILIKLSMVLFVFSCIRCVKDTEKNLMTKGARAAGLAVTLGVLVLCAAGLLLIWTAADANVIRGLQGRYFLPVLLLAALSLGMWKKPVLPVDSDRIVVPAVMNLVFLEMMMALYQVAVNPYLG